MKVEKISYSPKKIKEINIISNPHMIIVFSGYFHIPRMLQTLAVLQIMHLNVFSLWLRKIDEEIRKKNAKTINNSEM